MAIHFKWTCIAYIFRPDMRLHVSIERQEIKNCNTQCNMAFCTIIFFSYTSLTSVMKNLHKHIKDYDCNYQIYHLTNLCILTVLICIVLIDSQNTFRKM